MEYQIFKPAEVLRVTGLYSLHYFPFASGYVFSGERHPFWELVYVDQGEAEIGADKVVHRLCQGQVILHKPNEFHTIWANYAKGANIFVISFSCRGEAMKKLRGLCCTLSLAQRRLLARMITEGRRCFGPVLDVSEQKRLKLTADAPPCGPQRIVLTLTELLLELLEMDHESAPAQTTPHVTEEGDFAERFEALGRLMREHQDGSLRFSDLCHAAGLSGTVLKERFKRYTGSTVMDYYQRLRIEEARRMLRAGEKNVAQISDALGYSSPAAFSRQFRQKMGVSPLAYLRSVNEQSL